MKEVTLDPELERALNEQIKNEAYSSFLYLSMANWCSKRSLVGGYKFFKKQSEEELVHMHKIIEFMNDMNANPMVNPGQLPPNDFKSIYDAVSQSLTHEHAVTQSILDLSELADRKRQYNTRDFLDWFNKEQTEELSLFREIFDRANILGGNAMADHGAQGVELHEYDEYLEEKCG